jgi:hypothetical protein
MRTVTAGKKECGVRCGTGKGGERSADDAIKKAKAKWRQ